MTAKYSYAASVKSRVSDEIVNTYLIRPLAGIFVRLFYHTSLTPNHVTIASTIAGFVAAYFYLFGSARDVIVAGVLVTVKDILDSADGQLARAKQQFSRNGRFLDSIGDILVNFAVFAAISTTLYQRNESSFVIALGLLSFVGMTLRVSYHVFYQTSYLHLQDQYQVNRITEEIRGEDVLADEVTLHLQRLFQFFYGWQDRLMIGLDEWSRAGAVQTLHDRNVWYSNSVGLRLSGFMGLGTELFLLMIFSVLNRLEEYLILNCVVLNALWIATILYRRSILSRQIRRSGSGL